MSRQLSASTWAGRPAGAAVSGTHARGVNGQARLDVAVGGTSGIAANAGGNPELQVSIETILNWFLLLGMILVHTSVKLKRC